MELKYVPGSQSKGHPKVHSRAILSGRLPWSQRITHSTGWLSLGPPQRSEFHSNIPRPSMLQPGLAKREECER